MELSRAPAGHAMRSRTTGLFEGAMILVMLICVYNFHKFISA